MSNYLKLIRVHHYIKNLLVFAALACSGELFCKEKFIDTIIAFICFCLTSSIVYIINDIKDAEKDRNHPVKCHRPIASGAIPLKSAVILAVLLFVIVLFLNSLIFKKLSTLFLLLYLVLNIAYSFGLKNIAILDISILVSGFLIRIMYGAVVSDITVSNWLYLTVIVLSFYFALGKRRNEIKRIDSNDTRAVLKSYPVSFLDKSMVMCLTLANAFYALWSMDEKTVFLYNNNSLVFTVPIVILITMKYSMDVEGDSDGDPVEVLLHDKVLLILCLLYLLVMFVILYV